MRTKKSGNFATNEYWSDVSLADLMRLLDSLDIKRSHAPVLWQRWPCVYERVFFFLCFLGQATPKAPKHRMFGKQLLGSIPCVSTRWWMMIDVLLMNIMDEIVVYHSLDATMLEPPSGERSHSKHLFVALTKFTKVEPKWAMILASLYQWNGVLKRELQPPRRSINHPSVKLQALLRALAAKVVLAPGDCETWEDFGITEPWHSESSEDFLRKIEKISIFFCSLRQNCYEEKMKEGVNL